MIAAGPGGLWFTDYSNNKVGLITTAGTVTEFAAAGNPGGIVEGPDGNMSFTEYGAGKVARITPAGKITVFPLRGTDGDLWVAEAAANKFAQVTPAGKVTEFSLPSGTGPVAISDPDENVVAAGYDGDNIVELIIKPKSVASEITDAIMELKDALKSEEQALVDISGTPSPKQTKAGANDLRTASLKVHVTIDILSANRARSPTSFTT